MSDIIAFSPSPSLLGFGALHKLPEAFETRGIKRVIIFTDTRIVETGILGTGDQKRGRGDPSGKNTGPDKTHHDKPAPPG